MRNNKVSRRYVDVLLLLLCAGFGSPAWAQAGGTSPAAGLDGLSILYKLDAGVIGVTYGRRWLAGPKFTSTVQTGPVGTVDVRVRGMDTRKDPVAVTPEWSIADPDMIEVTAGRDNEFRITVKRPGESRLLVSAEGYSLELLVRGKALTGAVQVEITEVGAGRPGPDEMPRGSGDRLRVDQARQIGSTSRKTLPATPSGTSATST